MKANRSSKTAEAAAAFRAWHLLYGNPTVYEDPFAIQLTSSSWRSIVKNRLLTWLVIENRLRAIRPVFAEVLGRSRYAEGLLDEAIKFGVDQYVLLGAGLDSFALRRKDLEATLTIYELDHPASQEVKKKRLRKLGLGSLSNVEYVSVDFDKESLIDGLKTSSYSSERRAFFSWLGTTPYLTRDAVFQTLRSVASIAAAGSEIVFDYMIPKELVRADEIYSVEALERSVKRLGEPFISTFNPKTFLPDVCELGFELVEHMSAEQMLERYFSGRSDNLRPLPNVCFAHFRLCS